jgi:4-hydroxyacetophenone monooxygenase
LDSKQNQLSSKISEYKDVLHVMRGANIPVLLMFIFQMTGAEEWLAPPYAPKRGRGLGDNQTGGLPPLMQDEIRAAGVRALEAYFEGATPIIEIPPPALMARMLSVCMG